MTDFIQQLTEQINLLLLSQNIKEQVLPQRTKEMVIKAADETLVAATRGRMKNQHLERPEIGYVVAALVYDQPGFNQQALSRKTREF
ncbi:MAG: hypothetical protein KJ077_05905 [Anaerolineae bacterium]|nr:hypothetical protein [Anaerolineae bacterium]